MSSARPDLCGGRLARAVRTAIMERPTRAPGERTVEFMSGNLRAAMLLPLATAVLLMPTTVEGQASQARLLQ